MRSEVERQSWASSVASRKSMKFSLDLMASWAIGVLQSGGSQASGPVHQSPMPRGSVSAPVTSLTSMTVSFSPMGCPSSVWSNWNFRKCTTLASSSMRIRNSSPTCSSVRPAASSSSRVYVSPESRYADSGPLPIRSGLKVTSDLLLLSVGYPLSFTQECDILLSNFI